MIFKKKVRVTLGAILLLVIVFGLSLGNVYAREVDRIVTVTAAANEEFRNFWGPRYHWKDVIREIIERASRHFEEQFGISFKVEKFKEYDSEDRVVAYDVFEEIIKEVQIGDSEIVVTFSGQDNIKTMGAANSLLGSYVIIVDNISSIGWFKEEVYEKYKEFYQTQEGWKTWTDWCVRVIAPRLCTDISTVLIHELGHIFGADHTTESHSVMSLTSRDTTEFDDENKKIILRNKYVDFREVKALRTQAQVLYELAVRWADELEYTKAAEYFIKAANLYLSVGFTWLEASGAAGSYYNAGFCFEVTSQKEKALEAYKKAGPLYLEVAKWFERQDGKWMAMNYYEMAASCFKLAGHKERAEELYRRYEELKEKLLLEYEKLGV